MREHVGGGASVGWLALEEAGSLSAGLLETRFLSDIENHYQ